MTSTPPIPPRAPFATIPAIGSLRYSEEIATGDAYEGRKDRLGNTEKGDGRRFKGRGLIQLTGRANYTAYGASIGRNLLVNEEWTTIASDPSLAVDSACWFWKENGLNALADKDDVTAVTRRINGPRAIGLAERMVYLVRAKCLLLKTSNPATVQ